MPIKHHNLQFGFGDLKVLERKRQKYVIVNLYKLIKT